MPGKRGSVVFLALSAALGLAAPAAGATHSRQPHSHRAPARSARGGLAHPSDGGVAYVSTAPVAVPSGGPRLDASGGVSAPGVASGPTGPSGTAVGGASVGPHPPAVRPRSGATGASGPSGAVGATGSTGSTGSTGASGSNSSTGSAGSTGSTGSTGATGSTTVPGSVAEVLPDGLAVAPADAPTAVREVIAAGNQLIGLPYLYGGGHASFVAAGYDCSGAVSYALHGGALLSSPLDSSAFESWGLAGAGSWITVFTNPAHAYMDVAGIRLDTSTAGDPGGKSGPRWRPLLSSDAGFAERHPAGF
jgi:cell wall-associated NlpC family hydrolase